MTANVLLCLLVLATAADAGRARTWQQHAFDDFARGESHGVAIAADGALALGPALADTVELAAERVWSLLPNSAGGLFVGTGDSGRLFAVDADGRATLLFDSPELALHALAVGPDGALYAGSAPDGLIYKIARDGEAATLAQTGARYVWDLAFIDGRLHAATGQPGQVLSIANDGSTDVVFDPGTDHVMTLLAHGDRLYAGTAGKGRIYVIAGGASRLLYEAAQEEIHDLVADDAGRLFASAIPGADPPEGQTKPPAAVYRIAADGAVYPIWEHGEAERVVLAAAGRHLALAAAKPARLLHLDAEGRRALVLQFADAAPNRLALGPDGTLHLGAPQRAALTGLPGTARRAGHFESAPEDLGIHARWGAIEWRGHQPAGTRIAVKTRSGNSLEPDDTWSPWSAPLTQSGQAVASPPARFIQYRVELSTDDAEITPRLDWIAVHAVQTNLRPRIADLQTFPFRPQKSGNGGQPQAAPSPQGRGGNRPPNAKSLRVVRWQASDPNEDQLVYDLYLKGADQREWKLGEANLSQNSIMWDTETMPEGWTRLKLVASDRADNPADQSLSAERECTPFAIDNSPPVIELGTRVVGGEVVVEVAVSDRISAIQKAHYTIDYDDERHPIAPLDGIFDSASEKARFTVAGLEPGEHIIAVQILDALDNLGVRQAVVEIK